MVLEIVRIQEGHFLEPWFRENYRDYLAELRTYEPAVSGGHLQYWLAQPFCHALVWTIDQNPAGFACVETVEHGEYFFRF